MTQTDERTPGQPATRGADDGDHSGAERTVARTCPLCEAGCGLEITLRDGRVHRIRGDAEDVFSAGFLCPKGSTLGHLHDDPDRIRRPLVKRDGRFVEVDFDEAFAEIDRRLRPIVEAHGRDAVAVYIGNPNAHNLGAMLFAGSVVRAAGTRNRFSAGSVDQRPKELSASLMFGSVTVPVPDLDRTRYLVLLGADPWESNGSLCMAPDFPGRLRRLRERGGRFVVVDPRRSRTAEEADRHLAIRPGTDALLLAAIVTELARTGRADAGHLAPHTNGLSEVISALAPFTPERVAPACGIEAAEIAQLARELADAPCAAVYGRMGTCTQAFGTLTSWLVDIVNLVTGNLDREGGALFSTGAAGQPSTSGEPGRGRGLRTGRVRSRVSGAPECMGELPVSVLAEEMETPGEGQVRALICLAGNPVRSTPNSIRLDRAIAGLDLVVAVDVYLNETTRHADVLLPAPSPLQKSHYDLLLLNFAVRNVANWSPVVLAMDEGALDEWEIYLRLAGILAGDGPAADPAAAVDRIAESMVERAVADPWSNVHGRDPAELLSTLARYDGPEKLLDHRLRTGPFGDAYGAVPGGLSLALLEANPHGIDLGPLQGNRIPDLLRTPSGRIEAAPPEIMADLARLEASLDGYVDGAGLTLVGRRQLRSNNSWMHNVDVLVRGRERCTLLVHPDDAERHGLRDGGRAWVRSRTGCVEAPVEVTDAVRPGVVSLPHGWGHDVAGVRLGVAREHAGVNANELTDESFTDPVSGTVALNGVPVEVGPAPAPAG